jgi:hypothetical protein
MAVAGLGLQITDYQDAACAEVYGGDGYSSLAASEQAVIDRLILEAERTTFLHPPVNPPHVWSCLRDPGELTLWTDVAVDSDITVTGVESGGSTTVTASEAKFYETMIGHSIVITSTGTFTITGYTSSTVIVVSGDATCTDETFSITGDGVYRLPSDFESPDSPKIVWLDNVFASDIALANENGVNYHRAVDTSTGYPVLAYIRWVTSDGTAAQAQELVVWPRADRDYSVAMPYILQPQGMSTANPYPRGGPEMADLLLTGVIAVCEKERSGARGDRWAEFVQKCAIAVTRDRTRHHNFNAGRLRTRHGDRVQAIDVKSRILPGTYS